MILADSRSRTVVVVALAALMAATRIHHFGVGAIFPDASVAVFFLAGMLLGRPMALLAFLVEAALLDQFAFTLAGVSDWCFTPAYAALPPAYGALFFAGWASRGLFGTEPDRLARLAANLALGIVGFFVISNIGFWAASGYFAGLPLADYAEAVMKYLPPYLATGFAYSAAFLAVLGLALRSGRTAAIG
jgi:hypothetical protein